MIALVIVVAALGTLAATRYSSTVLQRLDAVGVPVAAGEAVAEVVVPAAEVGHRADTESAAPDPAGPAARVDPSGEDGPLLDDGALARAVARVGPSFVLALVVVLVLLWRETELHASYQVRVALMLVALVPIAVIDLRLGIVPDAVLVSLLGARAVVLGIDLASGVPGTMPALRADLAVAIVILLVLVLVRLGSRGSLGLGDVKLFAVLPLLLGPQLAIWSIMASFGVAFAYSIFVLATKRRTRRSAVPFAPFILAGTLLTVVAVSLPGS